MTEGGLSETEKPIVWFDIDNTLYSAKCGIADCMGERIHAYFLSLGLSDEEASALHLQYYKTYGLALRGLVRHHSIDPLDFDKKCDQSLPLEEMIRPDPAIRALLQSIDRSKVRVWALTNAYVTHARRVLRILNLDDLFEGVVYCDYTAVNFCCKPEPEFFNSAMEKAKVQDPSICYFIDDSRSNVNAARQLGWGHCVLFSESGLVTTEGGVKKIINAGLESSDGACVQVDNLLELKHVWPEIFTTGKEV